MKCNLQIRQIILTIIFVSFSFIGFSQKKSDIHKIIRDMNTELNDFLTYIYELSNNFLAITS